MELEKKKTWRIQKQTETIIRTMTTQTKLWEIFYSSSWFTETYAKLPWSQTQVNRNQPFATFDQLSFIHDTDLCRVQGQVSQMKNKKRKKKQNKQQILDFSFIFLFLKLICNYRGTNNNLKLFHFFCFFADIQIFP